MKLRSFQSKKYSDYGSYRMFLKEWEIGRVRWRITGQRWGIGAAWEHHLCLTETFFLLFFFFFFVRNGWVVHALGDFTSFSKAFGHIRIIQS